MENNLLIFLPNGLFVKNKFFIYCLSIFVKLNKKGAIQDFILAIKYPPIKKLFVKIDFYIFVMSIYRIPFQQVIFVEYKKMNHHQYLTSI